MPFNGVGVFTRVYQWVQDAANGIFVDATRTDTDSNDIAAGLTNCITRDGQSPWLANIPAGGFKITGLANGINSTDSVNYAQVFNNPTFTGTATFANLTAVGNISFSGGAVSMASATSVTVPTVSVGDNSTTAASTAFVVATAFQAALPAQTGNANKFITTDGANASWSNLIKVGTMLFADNTDSTKRAQFIASSITSGQTRTITLRDRNAVLGADLQLDSRTSNTLLTVADIGKFVDITSGTFTQTFDAAANLQSGWWIRLRNNGTGNITLDPNGAELIDGLSSYIMYPGEVRDIQCDGTKLTTVIIKPYRVRFTTSGTWTKPPGYSEHSGMVGSGGASGYKSSAGSISPGGCGGGAFPFNIPDAQLGATETITIGAGGAPQTVANTAGNTGGTSSFGSWISVIGGANDVVSGANNLGGTVADSKGNRLVSSTSPVVGFETNQSASASEGIWAGGKSDIAAAVNSGGSINGGGAGGSINAGGTLRTPGTSKTVGSGGAAVVAGNGVAGTFPCGGGGSTQTGAQSGAGANGYVDVWGAV